MSIASRGGPVLKVPLRVLIRGSKFDIPCQRKEQVKCGMHHGRKEAVEKSDALCTALLLPVGCLFSFVSSSAL